MKEEQNKNSVFQRFSKKFKRGGGLSGSMRGITKQKYSNSKGSWLDQWKPPHQQDANAPQQILLFKGDYHQEYETPEGKQEIPREYYVFYSHFVKHAYHGNGGGTTCGAGLALIPDEDGDLLVIPGTDPCVCCYHIEDGAPGIQRQKQFAFNAIRPGNFHRVPSANLNPKTNKPYMEWVSCMGKNCKHCKARVKKEYGLRVYWPMGIRFAEQLMAYEDSLLSMSCACGDSLIIEAFTCASCKDCVVDLTEEPMDAEQLHMMKVQPKTCPFCGHLDLLVPEKSCESCDSPEPLTIWDVILEVQKTGFQTDSSLMILGFTPLDEDTRSKLQDKMKPFDFAEGPLRVESPNAVCKRLQLQNPFPSESHSGSTERVNWKK